MLKPLKWYKTLATRKGRQESGMFLLEGRRSIAQIMQYHPEAIDEVLTLAPAAPEYASYRTRTLSEGQLRSISSTSTPQGTLAVARFPAAVYSNTLPSTVGHRVLALEDVQDPGNVGTLIRTAVAFDFCGVILTERCADPLAPKCVQATAGTVLSLWIRRTPRYLSLMQQLQGQGYTCVAADAHGQDELSVLASSRPLLLVLGNEAAGLSCEVRRSADVRIKIPLSRRAESLNVAVSGGICMYLASRLCTGDA